MGIQRSSWFTFLVYRPRYWKGICRLFDLQILIKRQLQTAKKYIKNNYRLGALCMSLIRGRTANECHMAQWALPADNIDFSPVWRLLICIKTPSGVVKKIHWAWSDGSSDLLREKRVRPRQSLFIVICDLTPFTDLPPLFTLGLFDPTLRAPCFVVHFAQRLIKLTKYLYPNFAYVRFFFLPLPQFTDLVVAWKIMLATVTVTVNCQRE